MARIYMAFQVVLIWTNSMELFYLPNASKRREIIFT